MHRIDYSKHYIDANDNKFVKKALNSNALTKGNNLKKFEKVIKNFVNSKFSIVLSNASSALLVSLKALDVKEDDIIWCSDNTYISTINCAIHLRAKIDLIDINIKDYNICVENLKKKLLIAKKNKKLPKILIVTHIAGYPCDLKIIYKLSQKYNFKIVEDASHALGSKYFGKRIGNCKYSELSIFSFHPSKTITTAEGGAITTNNKKIYNNLKLFRENGHDFSKNKFQNIDLNYYDVKKLGFNLRLNEISCALGISQMKKINNFINHKKKLAKNYFFKLDKNKFIFPEYSDRKHSTSWHLFILRINLTKVKKTKNEIIRYLKKNNIYVKTHYPPLSSFTLIKKNIRKKNINPNALKYYKTALSIPMYYNLSFKDQNYIIKTLNKA